MASFMDMLSGLGDKIGAGYQDFSQNFDARMQQPMTQLGLQMMLAAGPQQGNPGIGSRMAQALAGYSQNAMQQQQVAQQAQLRKIQQQEIEARQQAMEGSQQQRRAVMDYVKANPNILANNPLARGILENTGDVSRLDDIAKLTGGAVPQPKTPWQYKVSNPDGTVTEHTYNPQTQAFEAGQPYKPTAQQMVDISGRRADIAEQGLGIQQQGMDIRQQATGVAADKLALAQQKELREQNALQLKNNIAKKDLSAAYTGANNQLGDVEKLATEILESPHLGRIFGVNSKFPTMPGSPAAGLEVKLNSLLAKGGLSEIVRLGSQGIHLTPVSDNDIKMVQQSFANFDRSQDVGQAQETLKNIIAAVRRARDDAKQSYESASALYGGDSGGSNLPSGGQSLESLPRNNAGLITAEPPIGTVINNKRYQGGGAYKADSWVELP